MKKVSLITLGLLLSAAQVNAAEASDGTIDFTGKIESQTCTVSVNGGSNTETVTLPPVATGLLQGSGQTAGDTRFTIALSGCKTKDGKVYAYFEQTADVNTNGRLTNSGSAKNVDLQLLTKNGSEINAGSTEQISVNPSYSETLADGAATLTYIVRYYATAAAEAGDVASAVNYSISYL